VDAIAGTTLVYHRRAPMHPAEWPIELRAAVERARAAWPAISADDERFARRLLEILGDQPIAVLAELHVEDLYLAWTCAERNAEALAAFEARMSPVMDAILTRLGIDPARREDLLQDLRLHLVVGSNNGQGKLGQYRGQGNLERWLRATALRAAYRAASKWRRYMALDDSELAAVSALDHDPALVHLKEHCRIELKNSFAAALAALPLRDRVLLKQHYLDRLTIEDVAALHKIHRSSAARWLAQARAALADAVLRNFRERLRVSELEVESLVRLVRSQLDITLEHLLSIR